MDDLQPSDMRRRIRELLAIPERDRTDEQWDELNELEIRTAPGNKESDRSVDRQGDSKRPMPGPSGRRQERKPGKGGNNGNSSPRPQQEQQQRPEGGRLLKRQHRRPKRSGGHSGGSGPDTSGGGNNGGNQAGGAGNPA